MRMPAQVWQRLSVGGCSPRDNTQGQNTVQLHDSASSPFKLQLSVNAQLPPYSTLQSVRGDQPPVKVVRTITAPTAISTTPMALVKRRPVSIFSSVMAIPIPAI